MKARALKGAFVAAARERARYPGDVIGFGAFLAMLLFTFTQLWTKAAAGMGGRIGSYSPQQLVLYLLVTELVTLAPGAVQLGIINRVRSGDVATDLLRPVDWCAFEIARAAGASVVRVAVLATFGVPALLLLVGLPHVDARGIAAAAIVLGPLAVLLDCTARVLIGLLAFWFEDAAVFYWVWQKACFTLGGLMMPIDLYPSWLRAIAESLPFASILFAPARSVLSFDGTETLRAAATLVAWLIASWLALLLVFGRAARRLQLNGG